MPRLICGLGKALYSGKARGTPERIDRILFLKTGALGDILMTTPLVRAIRHRFPAATIDYACGKSYAQALRGNKNINYLVEFDERIFFNNDIGKLRALARRLKENRYDVILVLDKHWAAGVFASFAGNFRVGFDRNGEGFANNLNVYYRQNKHDIESYLDLAVYFRARAQGTRMDLQITLQDRAFARRLCRKNSIAIAPGGGVNAGQKARIKTWPKENFLKVADVLSKKYNIILVGGKEDRKISSWIKGHTRNGRKIKDVTGRTTTQQTAAVLERCKIVLTNDSGAMHIASCVNDRIISLFGPTDPRVLAPLNKGSVHIWKEKKACYDIYGNFGNCGKDIMKKITAEDVLDAAKRYW